MKRAEGKKRRVTMFLSAEFYARFHEYAVSNGWSDGRAGMKLVESFFHSLRGKKK